MSVNPKPSYHLCPDFSISPPPNGHLTLGSILKNLDVDGVAHPLNIHGSTIDIPDTEVYPRDAPDSKFGLTSTLGKLRSVEGSFWAKIFGVDGLGGSLGFLRKRTDDETLTVEDVQTRYFSPTEEYMKQSLELPNVALFVNVTKMKVPLYMVTGIKVAVGAKLTKAEAKTTQVHGEGAGTDPHSGTSAGGRASYTSEDSVAVGFDGSKPFVLGFRVRKIWWKEGIRQTSDKVVGSTLEEGKSRERPSIVTNLDFIDDFTAAVGDTAGNMFVDEEGGDGIEPSIWVLP